MAVRAATQLDSPLQGPKLRIVSSNSSRVRCVPFGWSGRIFFTFARKIRYELLVRLPHAGLAAHGQI
jgi:hypothetical protein